MTNTPRPATVNTGSTVHLAVIRDGVPGIDCGAIRYRNTTQATIRLRPEGTPVTCKKCLAAAPVEEAPEAEEAQPLTFMQRQRLAGKAR